MVEPTYDEYLKWHSSASERYLEPARDSAVRMLNELLDDRVEATDRARFRIATSRVKSAPRSFAKLTRDKYRLRFTAYDDVPNLIDDLVGLRLICNNLSDIITFQEIVGELPVDSGNETGLSVEADSQRDYFAEPKPSGYRAFHINFVVPVARAHETKRVRVEVQARTLLQDGWGELTHEDTYKPGSVVPDWIVRMSLRMADLLAAVDDIAQDLRTGLDVVTQNAVDPHEDSTSRVIVDIVDASTAGPPEDVTVSLGGDQLRKALVREVHLIVESLQRPTGLASISQLLTARFGSDITQVWANSGGFRKFLQLEVPDISVTGPMPGYVHPRESSLDGWPPLGEPVKGVPDLIRELRTHDKGLPLISAQRMLQAITSVAAVVNAAEFTPTDSGRVSAGQLAVLARLAREYGDSKGYLVVRPHAQYILLALNRAGAMRRDTTVEKVKLVLREAIMGNLEKSGLLKRGASSRGEIDSWLSGKI